MASFPAPAAAAVSLQAPGDVLRFRPDARRRRLCKKRIPRTPCSRDRRRALSPGATDSSACPPWPSRVRPALRGSWPSVERAISIFSWIGTDVKPTCNKKTKIQSVYILVVIRYLGANRNLVLGKPAGGQRFRSRVLDRPHQGNWTWFTSSRWATSILLPFERAA